MIIDKEKIFPRPETLGDEQTLGYNPSSQQDVYGGSSGGMIYRPSQQYSKPQDFFSSKRAESLRTKSLLHVGDASSAMEKMGAGGASYGHNFQKKNRKKSKFWEFL